jgi:ATP-dependent Clp protease ATP-binding subunit ClpC
LLGLLREDEGLVARVLDTQNASLEEARAQVSRIVGRGADSVSGAMPVTPRARTVLELALQESRSLGHAYIGTEHIPLGLVCERCSPARAGRRRAPPSARS